MHTISKYSTCNHILITFRFLCKNNVLITQKIKKTCFLDENEIDLKSTVNPRKLILLPMAVGAARQRVEFAQYCQQKHKSKFFDVILVCFLFILGTCHALL